jgi:hypothetical protein
MTSMSAMATDSNHLRCARHIVHHGTTVDWNPMKSHQTLADLRIGIWINLASFGIPEKVVESVVSTLAVVICSLLANISTMANTIVDGSTVRSLLLWLVVAVVRPMMRLSIATI